MALAKLGAVNHNFAGFSIENSTSLLQQLAPKAYHLLACHSSAVNESPKPWQEASGDLQY